jgi:hypothetical protein
MPAAAPKTLYMRLRAFHALTKTRFNKIQVGGHSKTVWKTSYNQSGACPVEALAPLNEWHK